ncbi:MAG: diguanylate cyclase domain-containing protein [Thermotogota bacterium]
MKKGIVIISFIILIIVTGFSENVLILHSYCPLYDWTRDVNKGLESVLLKSNYNIFIEYLYSRNSSSKEYKDSLIEVLSLRYEKTDIDAVIITDQYAFDLISNYRNKVAPEIPLFFLGAEFIRENSQDFENVYGIFGESNIDKNIDLVTSIYPGEKILITNNKDELGGNIIETVEKMKDEDGIDIVTINSDDFYKTIETILEYPSDTPIILGNLTMEKDKNLGQLREISQEFEESLENPIFTLWNNQIGYGAIGGYVTEGIEEGERLANKVLEYFKNPNIPKFERENYVYKFDYEKLQTFEISENQLPQNSIIINKPKNTVNQYLLWIIIIFVLFLILMTFYSMYHMLKMRREKKSIEDESYRDTLTRVYNRKKLESLKRLFNDKNIQKEIVTYVIDLDNLKPINDSFGHDVGDKFIIYAAEILNQAFDSGDYIFRVGGDEFYVVAFLELDDLKQNINFINSKIKKLINEKKLKLDKPFNLSFGYAVKRSYEPIEETIKRADETMYINKQKNKIND